MTARLILPSENERTSMHRTVYVLGVIVASGAILTSRSNRLVFEYGIERKPVLDTIREVLVPGAQIYERHGRKHQGHALPHRKSNPGPISRLSAHALHEAAYAALRSPGVSTGRE